MVEGDNLAAALEELKVILMSPIKAAHREDKERDETEIGSDVKITSTSTAGSDFILTQSDSNTAVPDEDIPVKFTKVMGKGKIWKWVKAWGFLVPQTSFTLAQKFLFAS